MFKFKLQVPLDHRKRLVDLARNEHSKAVRILLEEKNLQEKMKTDLYKSQIEYVETKKKNPDSEILKLFEAYFLRAKFEMAEQKKVTDEKRKDVEIVLNKLVDTTKNKKALEIFKEKCQEEYKRKELIKERKFMDEISTTRYRFSHDS